MKILNYMIFFTLIALSLFGCGGSGGGSSNGSSGGCVSADSDSDGDGLTCAQETEGWEVWPDRFGLGLGTDTFGQMEAHYAVKSDPSVADTDGDGLDDHEEFLIQSDPTMADTDQDGLTDYEEVMRWGTSALSVDTDADSRGPDKDLSPNVNLFDGAELKIDFANDPDHNVGVGATSPAHEDTDGDGWSDYYELVEATGNGFLPFIADVPVVEIEIASSPIIRITGSYESGTEWSKDVAITNTLSQSRSSASSVSKSTELAIENTHTTGVELGTEVGTSGGDLHAVFSLTASYEFSHARSTSTAHDVSWSKEQSITAEETYEESRGVGASETLTLDGGYVSVGVNLFNNGNVAFTLADVRINLLARYVDGTNNFATVLELRRDDDVAVTLAPGQSVSNVLMMAETNDYQLLQSLLKNQSGMMLEMASYSVTDQDGGSFGFTNESILQKSAMVLIDYGGELASEVYLFATNPARSPDQEGVTMATVMTDIINVPYETTRVEADSGSADILSAVRTVQNDASLYRAWLVSTNAQMEQLEATSFDDIVVTAGDVVYLTHVKDQDQDGLIAREERLNGTSDADEDTDDDTLMDYDEVVAGWDVNIEGVDPYKAYSYGYNVDSDQDGIDDVMERDCGLDPLFSDTDLDGITDYEELFGFDVMLNDALVTTVVPYTGAVILDGGNGIMETTAVGDDALGEAAGFVQGGIVILAGSNGTIESLPEGDDFLATEHRTLDCSPSGFATDPLDSDTDGESVNDGVERAIGLGSPNNPSDHSQYIDTDGDGVSDAVEALGFTTTVNGSQIVYTSDPAKGDTDDDGLPDLLERMIGSNPKQADTDGDTLSDYDEYSCAADYAFAPEGTWASFEAQCLASQSCVVPSCHDAPWTDDGGSPVWTDLRKSDTDDDGLSDGVETGGWQIHVTKLGESSPTSSAVSSNPLLANSDNDYLSDYGEHAHGSDPAIPDTDGDGDNDGLEVSICTPTQVCRDPATWDRKITVTYLSVDWDGNCDDVENEEMLIRLYLQMPGGGYTRLVYFDRPESQNQPKHLVYNASESFIAQEGQEFALVGYVAEMDNPNEPWAMYADASLVFCPANDCDTLLQWHGLERDADAGETNYVVGPGLSDISVEFNEEGESCGFVETRTFTSTVHATIEVD